MRIALDGRCLNTTHLRGMGKMAFELLRESANHPDISFAVLGDEPRAPIHVPDGGRIAKHSWETRGHRFRAWEQFSLPRYARRLECDVLHCAGTWCPVWQPLPLVVTVHDTLPWVEERPSMFLNYALPAAYQRAKRIITVSENSKRDILAQWPSLAGKISVIPHGIHPRYLADRLDAIPPALEAAGVRTPYLLYFGGEIPRKRLDWAIEVWKKLDRDDLNLVVCGLADASVPRWMERLPRSLRSRVSCLDFVPEDALPSLYANAEALLYPTLYEGFGFPALEAQAVGTPVLMTDRGSLKELAGPGAIVLPAEDLDAWVDAADAVLSGTRPAAAAMRAWARTFSWHAAFTKTLDVYRLAAAS